MTKLIKSIQIITKKMVEEQVIDEYQSAFRAFAPNGKMILDQSINQQGEIEEEEEWNYDENDRLIQYNKKVEGLDFKEPTKYFYTEEGALVKTEQAFMDGSLTIRKYTLDVATNELSIRIEDEDGEYDGKETQILDSKGRVLEQVMFDYNDQIEQKFAQVFDEEGRLIERTEWGMDSEFLHKKKFQFTVFGATELEYTYSESDKLIGKRVYKYNEHEHLIGIDIEENLRGLVQNNQAFVTDEKGNCIEEKHFNEEGFLTERRSYEYDADGNMTKQVYYGIDKSATAVLELGNKLQSLRYETELKYTFY